MTGQQEQQHQGPPPPQTVGQHPVVDNERTKICKQKPFFLRGARFAHGLKIPGCAMFLMVGVGASFLIIGVLSLARELQIDDDFPTIPFSDFPTIPFSMAVIGAFLFVPGLLFCRTASRQYDALPPDHPHRYKYGTGYVLRSPVATYDFPRRTQMVSTPRSSPTGGYPMTSLEPTTPPHMIQEQGNGHRLSEGITGLQQIDHTPSAPVDDEGPPSYSEAIQSKEIPQNADMDKL